MQQDIYLGYFSKPEIVQEYKDAVSDIGLWNAEKESILKHISKAANILDIGTGAGRVSYGLWDLGYKNITGTDFCEEIINEAIKINTTINNIKFIKDDIVDCSLFNDTYDAAIFSFNGLIIIPHHENRIKALKHINRILRQNGIFIFSTDNSRYRSPKFWEEELLDWKQNKKDVRVNKYGEVFYTRNNSEFFFYFPRHEEIVEMLIQTGFVVLEDFDINTIYPEEDKVIKFAGDEHIWIAQKFVNI